MKLKLIIISILVLCFYNKAQLEEFKIKQILSSFVLIVTTENDTPKYLGSGIIIDNVGHIITIIPNITKFTEFMIYTSDKNKLKVKLLGYDKRSKISVLKIIDEISSPIKPITFSNTNEINPGDNGYAIAKLTIPDIVISDVKINSISDETITLTTNVSNFNYGIVSTQGELIGIITGNYFRNNTFTGIAFGVSADFIKTISQELISYGKVTRPGIQIIIDDLNDNLAIETNYNSKNGVIVLGFSKDSTSLKAGMQTKDIIVAIDEIQITNTKELTNYIKRKKPNDIIKIKIFRNDSYKLIDVKVIGLSE